jgi:hypothetical protein
MKGVVGGVEGGGVARTRSRCAAPRRDAEPCVILGRQAGLADPDDGGDLQRLADELRAADVHLGQRGDEIAPDGSVTISPSSLSHVIASRTGSGWPRTARRSRPLTAGCRGGSARKGWRPSSRHGSAARLVDPGRCPGSGTLGSATGVEEICTVLPFCSVSSAIPDREGSDNSPARPMFDGRRGEPMTTAARPHGIAMIGTGMVARTHLSAIRDADVPVRLSACCRGRGPRGRFRGGGSRGTGRTEVGLFRSGRDLRGTAMWTSRCPDPARCAPSLIAPLAEAGKRCPLEKPMGRNAARREECRGHLRAAGVPLGVVFQHRMREASRKAAQLIAKRHDLGALGLASRFPCHGGATRPTTTSRGAAPMRAMAAVS